MLLKAKAGDLKASDYIVMSNLLLVARVVRRFRLASFEFSDLVQEGSIGILDAIEKYDPALGAFRTYMRWHIRKMVKLVIRDRDSVVRIPAYVLDARSRVHRTFDQLTSTLGRSPSIEELAVALPRISPGTIRQCLRTPATMAKSVDSLLDEEFSPHELLADSMFLRPDRSLAARIMADEVQDALRELEKTLADTQRLSGRSKDIFRSFYSLGGSLERRTLKETGDSFGVTREWVRRTIEKCWAILGREGIALTKERMHAIRLELDDLEDLTHECFQIR